MDRWLPRRTVPRHSGLPEHDPGELVDRREQVPERHLHLTTVGVAGTAQGLAIHRRHSASIDRSHPGAHSRCTNAPIAASTPAIRDATGVSPRARGAANVNDEPP